MFDIGLPELLIVLVVSLLVLGPNKIPEIVKGITKIYQWGKRTSSEVKLEIEKTVGLNEIKQDLHNEQVLKGLKNKKK